NPLLSGQVISVADEALGPDFLFELERNAAWPEVPWVRYEEGKRLVASYAELEASAKGALRHADLPWKEGGTYLITGGGGNLGLIFAEEMTRTRAESLRGATVVLTGRSRITVETQAAIDRIRARGGAAEYRRLDVTDEEAVRRVVQDVVREFGALNGIIHCAG